jgi:mono/diheme cytochrome c family protein
LEYNLHIVRYRFLLAIFALWTTGSLSAAETPSDGTAILTRRCIVCHGPKTKTSGLDLSTRESALKGGSRGSALQPSDASRSLLFRRVSAGEMPPNAALNNEEKDLLRQWIDSGARWASTLQENRAGPDWWSLQPLRTQAGADASIDSFILSKLRDQGLKPSPTAGRRTLIRRLSFDLTGLPPSPEEVEAFIADPSPGAYERLVDRLLASPHYGERWARHWLDTVRFSESEGFERDTLRDNAWPYRDYVIQSFNEDKSYIQFAREQIAGDVLEPVTRAGIVATGLLVAGPTDAVGLTSAVESQRALVREDQLEDMVSVVSQTFLGMTANCARCHDHKFDPIPQRDYYRFKAALTGVWQPFQDPASIELLPGGRPVLTPAEQRSLTERISSLQSTIHNLEGQISAIYRGISRLKSNDAPAPSSQWTFDIDTRDQRGNLHAELKADAQLGNGRLKTIAGKDTATITTSTLETAIAEKTLEAWILVRKLPEKTVNILQIANRSGYRGASVDGIQFQGEKKKWQNLSTASFRTEDVKGPSETASDGERVQIAIVYNTDGSIRLYRNGAPYGVSYRPEADNAAGRLQTYNAGDAVIKFTVTNGLELDEARIYNAALTEKEIAASYRAGCTSLVPEEAERALKRAEHVRLKSLQSELDERRRELESLPAPQKTYAADPRDPGITHLLIRGDLSRPGEVLAPAGLSCIKGLPADFGLRPEASDAERRIKLAAWIANPANPLFSRVIVNRVWQYHFGTGLVENPNDFGFNGGQPSHPELLDWLANQFIQDGWSLKKLHKRIVMSPAYQQESTYNSQSAAVDSGNRFLWRYSPRRLDAEPVRDAMLVISGKLNDKVGGPSFRPFTAKNLGGSYAKYEQRDSDEPDLQRRTIYRMNVNSGGDPLLDSLDCPVPSVKSPKRPSTTTALQSLSLMNNAMVLRLSKAFASRVAHGAEGVDAQVQRAFQLALNRPPTSAELDISRSLVKDQGLEALAWGLFNASEFLYLN